MTEPRVLACSLNARDAAERAERWRRLLEAHVVGRDALPAGHRLTFSDTDGVAPELDALVAAERQCCPFLTLTVVRAGGAVVLEVAAPAEALPVVDAMFGAPGERRQLSGKRSAG
jgi:MerR family transcriptional regulator, copper efflux regulator